MRMQNKIVSLVLVLALLLGVFVVIPVTPVVASAAEGGDFTPNATFVQTSTSATLVDAVKSNVANNHLGAVNKQNCNDGKGIALGILTDANGNKYLEAHRMATDDTGYDTYFSFWPDSSIASVKKDANTNQYIVLDMDLAVYEPITGKFNFYAVCRGSAAGFGVHVNTLKDAYTNVFNANVGKFQHITYVLDFDNDVAHLFINGAKIGQIANGVYGGRKDLYEEGFKFEQFRMFAWLDTEVLFDNVSIRKAADVTSLASALEASNISAWSENVYKSGYEMPSVPAIAKADGKELTSYTALETALDSILPTNVEILRDLVPAITVNGDATVETHDLAVKLSAGENVTSSVNGSVMVFNAPHSATVSTAHRQSASNILAATVVDGSVSGINPASNFTNETADHYIVTDKVTGNKYLDFRPGSSFTTGTTHNLIDWLAANVPYQSGKYMVMEFDTYVEAEILKDLYVCVTSRNKIAYTGKAAGSNIAGAQTFVRDWGIPVGEWAHITVVGSVDANSIYIYVNGSRVVSKGTGLWSGGATIEQEPYFQGLRFNVNSRTNMNANQNFAIDNVKYTMNYTDEWLVKNYGAESLSGWSLNSYTLPTAPVLATVDGKLVYNNHDFSTTLYGNNAKTAEILRPYLGTVTVNCDAVVETNGYTAPAAGEGVTVTNNGTVYTYDAPFVQSVASKDVSTHATIMNTIKTNTDGNLFVSMSGNGFDGSAGVKSAVVTNTITGDEYVTHYLTDDAKNGGAYVQWNSSLLFTYDENKAQYLVYDVDVSAVTTGGALAFMNIVRFKPNGSSDYVGPLNGGMPTVQTASGNKYGDFDHYTFVFNLNKNQTQVYRNGGLVGVYKVCDDTQFNKYLAGEGQLLLEGLRVAMTTDNVSTLAVDNLNFRRVETPLAGYAADSLSAAYANLDISDWSDAITTASSHIAPIATVNGEYVATESELSKALVSRNQLNVEILRDGVENITVNADAVINTNGLDVNLVPAANVTVSENGNVKTYDAPWKASATSTDSNSSINKSNVAANVGGNLLSGLSYGNWNKDSITSEMETNIETGDVYLSLTGLLNKTTANHFVNVTNSSIKVDYTNIYVLDMDLATTSDFLDMTATIIIRGKAGVNKPYDAASPSFGNLVPNDGAWHHLTIIGDTVANKMYCFVDGVLVNSSNAAYNKSGVVEGEIPSLDSVRINIGGSVAMTVGDNLCFDNYSIRNFAGNDAGIADVIKSGSLSGWSDAIAPATVGNLPEIATVNGVSYVNTNPMTAALAEGRNNVVVLERAMHGDVYAGATATVVTNGLANFVEGAMGYQAVDNGNGTYSIIPDTRTGNLVVKLGDKEIINQTLPYGTDIAEYLNVHNSYIAADSGRGAIAADNGALYYHLTWNTVPSGIVSGDVTYTVSGTEFIGAFLILENGQKRDNENDLTQFLSWDAKDSRKFEIILGTDYMLESSTTAITAPGGYKHIYLNGHTLTFNPDVSDTTKNAFVHALSGAGNTNIKFVGGNIVDNVRANTQAIFYGDYGYSGTLSFINCNIYTVAKVVVARGGNYVFDNCDIRIIECQNTAPFDIAEYYNAGYTKSKVTLNLINSDFSFTHITDRQEPVIAIKGITSWNKWVANGEQTDANVKAALEAGADKIAHEINIVGCTINNSFTNAFIRSQNPYAVINIKNSQLNVKTLFSNAEGNITIGNNVLSATPLGHLGEGIVEVKSGNPLAPYLYTDRYATVVWADGTVEKWAEGSYPVNAKYSKADVPMVEAGKTYNIGDNATVDVSMKANLTLEANLKLNVYVPTATNLTALNIAGVVYDVANAPVVKIGGADFYHFVYEMAPHLATGNYVIVATVSGVTVTKSVSLVEYADLVAEQYADNEKANNLAKAILTYVSAAAKYVGAYSQGYDAANNYADVSVSVNTDDAVNTMANVNEYLTGASLDLNAAPAWAFNVKAGADISTLVVKVNGNSVEYTVENGKVIVELPAYDMLDTITVEVDGKTGTYNFAAYYTAMKTLADSINLEAISWRAGKLIKEAEAEYAMSLLDAFYSYCAAAAAYK